MIETDEHSSTKSIDSSTIRMLGTPAFGFESITILSALFSHENGPRTNRQVDARRNIGVSSPARNMQITSRDNDAWYLQMRARVPCHWGSAAAHSATSGITVSERTCFR